MKLSYDDKQKIYQLRKQGYTIPQLSKQFNINPSNINYMIRLADKYGIEGWDYAEVAKLKGIKPGKYKVKAEDEGEYKLFALKSISAYYQITSDANGRDIVSNEIFGTRTYISVKEGQFLTLERCIAIKANQAPKLAKKS